MFRSLFVQELDRYRLERQWSLRAFARNLGVARGVLDDIMRGTRQPSLRFARRVAEHFGESAHWAGLLWFHLHAELPTLLREKTAGVLPPSSVSRYARESLSRYLSMFRQHYFQGTGLWLYGDVPALRTAVQSLLSGCQHLQIPVRRVDPSTPEPLRTDADILTVHLLSFERVDVEAATLVEVLTRRAAAHQPTIVTSSMPPRTPRPMWASRMQRLSVNLPTSTS